MSQTFRDTIKQSIFAPKKESEQMVDLWKYYAFHHKITVVTKDGKEYTGFVADVVDKNEDEDGVEDSIHIDLDGGGIMSFDESSIQEIRESR